MLSSCREAGRLVIEVAKDVIREIGNVKRRYVVASDGTIYFPNANEKPEYKRSRLCNIMKRVSLPDDLKRIIESAVIKYNSDTCFISERLSREHVSYAWGNIFGIPEKVFVSDNVRLFPYAIHILKWDSVQGNVLKEYFQKTGTYDGNPENFMGDVCALGYRLKYDAWNGILVIVSCGKDSMLIVYPELSGKSVEYVQDYYRLMRVFEQPIHEFMSVVPYVNLCEFNFQYGTLKCLVVDTVYATLDSVMHVIVDSLTNRFNWETLAVNSTDSSTDIQLKNDVVVLTGELNRSEGTVIYFKMSKLDGN